MSLDKDLNTILKEMWRLDEKMSGGEDLNDAENNFYKLNLEVIKNYYKNQNSYWKEK